MQEGQNEQQPEPAWQYTPEQDVPPTPPVNVPAQPASTTMVQWTASEFVEHAKSAKWYMLLALGTIVLSAGIYLFTRDKVSASIVVITAILFGVFAARKPRELQYAVDQSGVHIGPKDYPYATLKSFSVVQEDGVQSIWLMPIKRFMPIITIYFSPTDSENIVNTLSAFLPFENKQMDAVDRLMHRLRF